MARWWRKLRGSEDRAKEPAEASTSEEVFDSDMEIGDEDDFCESPTLVTVDDGKGGIKHIKVNIVILLDIWDWASKLRIGIGTFYYPGVSAAGVSGRERVLLSQLHHWGPRLESPGRGPGRHGQEGAGRQTLPQLRAPPREAQEEDHLQEGPRQHREGEGVQKVIKTLKILSQ